MTIASKICPATASGVFAAALVFSFFASPVRAADPTFPPASVVGLVPPAGMVVSKSFPGFEDVDKDAAILLAAQAPTAYEDLKKSLDTDALEKQGITVETRADLPLAFGTGTLVIGKQEADKKMYRKWLVVAPAKDLTVLVNAQEPINETAYPDAVIRAALATLAVRDRRPGRLSCPQRHGRTRRGAGGRSDACGRHGSLASHVHRRVSGGPDRAG